jgi:hypothetical protein
MLMVLLKVLGMIDVAAAFAFLMLVFGIQPFTFYMIFCILLLIVKGFFAFTSTDILSFLDLVSAILLALSIFFSMPLILLWLPACLLLAKGLASLF